MAAANETKDRNYYMVRNYKFVRSVKEKTAISVSREYNSKTYHDEIFNSISGKITGFMVWDEDKNGKNWQMLAVNLNDGKENECIQMYFGGYASETLLNRLFNVDFSKDVTIKVMKLEKTDKDDKGTGVYKELMCIYQGVDEKGKQILVKGHFSKEVRECDFGKIPELKQVGTAKKPKWDNSERCEFWENILNITNEKIRAMFQESEAVEATKPEAKPEHEGEALPNGDLPF